MVKTNKNIAAIFQLRHTLSHNYGLVTTSDNQKFKAHTKRAITGEVIDPRKDGFGKAVSEFLIQEAEAFTEWLLESTASYLKQLNSKEGITLDQKLQKRIGKFIGTHRDVASLPWTP
jgi:hypothetical protein